MELVATIEELIVWVENNTMTKFNSKITDDLNE